MPFQASEAFVSCALGVFFVCAGGGEVRNFPPVPGVPLTQHSCEAEKRRCVDVKTIYYLGDTLAQLCEGHLKVQKTASDLRN